MTLCVWGSTATHINHCSDQRLHHHQVVKAAEKYEHETGQDGFSSYSVRAQLAVLAKKWAQAEDLLVAQGQVDAAIEMYKEVGRRAAGTWREYAST